MPEANLRELQIPRTDAQRDDLVGVDSPYTELQVIERDSAISIYGALDAEAEEVFGRLEGRRQCEGPEERLLGPERSLEAQIRDFAGRGVDPLIVVVMDFLREEAIGVTDRRDVLPQAGPDEVVLQPAVGPFDLALRLRREGVDGLDPALADHLLPLRVDVVGQAGLPDVERIAAPDEAEDRMAVDVVGVRIPIPEHQPLHRVDVSPDRLLRDELREEEVPAEVIQRGDQVPLARGGGRPEVMGRVVLNQLPDVAGQHFPVMALVRPTRQVEAMPFRPVNDRGEGRLLMVRGLQPTLHVAVVIGAQRDLGVLDRPLIDGEFLHDGLFDPRIKVARGRAPRVLDGERRGVGPVAGEELEELRLAQAQHGPDVGAFDLLPQIPLQHVLDLLVRKALMQLSHLLKPSCVGSRIGTSEEFTFKT